MMSFMAKMPFCLVCLGDFYSSSNTHHKDVPLGEASSSLFPLQCCPWLSSPAPLVFALLTEQESHWMEIIGFPACLPQ